MVALFPGTGWGRAASAFRLAFSRIAPKQTKHSISDIRWSLNSIDPSVALFCGNFRASDRAQLPYRLWLAEEPRAVAILLHGAFDYSGAFDEIGPQFAARGINAFAYDQRGFGATRERRHWCGRQRMTEDLIDAVSYMRTRNLTLPIFVVGESMGGAIAVHAAANAPNLDVAGLVLAAPGAIAGIFRRIGASLLVRTLNYFAPKSEITIERLSAKELSAAAAIRLLCDPLVLRGLGPRMAFGLLDLAATAVDEGHKVSVPTLTMVGSKEDFLKIGAIAYLHKSFAGDKTWREFEEGPHLLLHWRNADLVLDEVFAWIDAHMPKAEQSFHAAAE
jgi:acylglycerol lipase